MKLQLPKLPAWNPIALKAAAIKWGAVILLVLTTHGSAYFYGKAVQRQETLEDTTKALVKEVKRTAKEGQENAAIGEKIGREVAEREARLHRAREELQNAIEEARIGVGDVGCPLSDDQLRAFQAIYDSY